VKHFKLTIHIASVQAGRKGITALPSLQTQLRIKENNLFVLVSNDIFLPILYNFRHFIVKLNGPQAHKVASHLCL
jgi:hypothetical protein